MFQSSSGKRKSKTKPTIRHQRNKASSLFVRFFVLFLDSQLFKTSPPRSYHPGVAWQRGIDMIQDLQRLRRHSSNSGWKILAPEMNGIAGIAYIHARRLQQTRDDGGDPLRSTTMLPILLDTLQTLLLTVVVSLLMRIPTFQQTFN